MAFTVRLRITPETKEELKKFKVMHQCEYDEILRKLINEHKQMRIRQQRKKKEDPFDIFRL